MGTGRPYIEPSDMFKAFNLMRRNIDEWMENVDELSSVLHNCPLPMHRDKIQLSYSQKWQALRVTDYEHDMCITARYNVWNEELHDFVDRLYFRKASETQKAGDGILAAEYEADGRIFIEKAFLNRTGNTSICDLLTDEQTAIWLEISDGLMFLHDNEDSGIICTHNDDSIILRTTRYGDYDSIEE